MAKIAGSGIYKIINTVNNKVYIGSTTNLSRRQKDHFRNLSERKHPNTHLQSAVNKYGIEKFQFIIIEQCENKQLLTKEQHYIDIFNSYIHGYNMCPDAKSTLGRKHSELAKKKMSLSRIGKPGHTHTVSKETREKLSIAHKGKKLSPEHITKITVNLSQRTISDKTRKKLSLSKIGNQYTKGRKLPLSQRLNISKGNMGRIVSNETKLKISNSIKLFYTKRRQTDGESGNNYNISGIQ